MLVDILLAVSGAVLLLLMWAGIGQLSKEEGTCPLNAPKCSVAAPRCLGCGLYESKAPTTNRKPTS